MIAVIFEVELAADGMASYLEHAERLKPLLAAVEGFISVERFQSLSDPGKLVSLSFWRDEAAVRAWREQAEHRITQRAGRAGLFADYRLRVAAVLRDYGMRKRDQAPSSCPILPADAL